MPNHHALVYIADSVSTVALPDILKIPSVDVVHLITERLLIGEARQLIRDAATMPVSEAHRTFVVVARDLQIEAQNALLKLFEEPPVTTRFVLIVPRLDVLLPTLRSRVHLVSGHDSEARVENSHFETFLRASYAERMAFIADYAKDKDTHAMESIVRGAELYAAVDVQQHAKLLTTILIIRDYFGFPGASRKMLLESLALSLPKA